MSDSRISAPRRTPRIAMVVAAAVVSLGAAACGGGPDGPGPTPPSAAPATSAVPPTSAASRPASPSAEPSLPASASPSATPPAPDPRSIDIQTLLRPGTQVLHVIYGDVDGDGVDDLVLASAVAEPPPGALMAQSYLDVFRYDGQGWPRAWEATEPAPPGNPDSPASVLAEPEPAAVSQQIDFLNLIDMAHDGSAELAVGILNVGAGPGPLDVWVIGFGPEGAVNDFSESTTAGGVLVAAGDQVKLQAPDFQPGDPACCPSRIDHQTIGFDAAKGRVRVLHETFTPVA
ncbi:MAG: hypothetical protein ACJ77A_14985 [Actinomycetota bacterium]